MTFAIEDYDDMGGWDQSEDCLAGEVFITEIWDWLTSLNTESDEVI